MQWRMTLIALLGVSLLVAASGCRLDIFRRGALFRQPATVVAPQPDPCAPGVIDPSSPTVAIPGSQGTVYPGTTTFLP